MKVLRFSIPGINATYLLYDCRLKIYIAYTQMCLRTYKYKGVNLFDFNLICNIGGTTQRIKQQTN